MSFAFVVSCPITVGHLSARLYHLSTLSILCRPHQVHPSSAGSPAWTPCLFPTSRVGPRSRAYCLRRMHVVEPPGTAPGSRSVLNSEELRAFVVQAPPETFHDRDYRVPVYWPLRRGGNACGEARAWCLFRLFSTLFRGVQCMGRDNQAPPRTHHATLLVTSSPASSVTSEPVGRSGAIAHGWVCSW